MVVAASLLTTGFVVAAAFLLWRQYEQQGKAVEGLRAAAQRRDAARANLQQELDEVRAWAARTLESLPAASEEPPRRSQARRRAGTATSTGTWTEPSLFAVTDLDADSGSRRSRYAEHLVKVYGGSGQHTTACLGASATRWLKQRPSLNVHSGCSNDPFLIYAVGAWPAHKVAEALAAGHDRYTERWYGTEPLTPGALDLAGPATVKLETAAELVRRALRAVGQVERLGRLPDGCRDWEELDQQQAVHQQLAAAITAPADALASATARLAVAVEVAADDTAQLSAERFASQLGRLRPLIGRTAELDALCETLADRIEVVVADLVQREENDIDDYGAALRSVKEALEHALAASEIALAMQAGFTRLTVDSVGPA